MERQSEGRERLLAPGAAAISRRRPELPIRKQAMEGGGLALWDDFKAELRTRHLGTPLPPGPESNLDRLGRHSNAWPVARDPGLGYGQVARAAEAPVGEVRGGDSNTAEYGDRHFERSLAPMDRAQGEQGQADRSGDQRCRQPVTTVARKQCARGRGYGETERDQVEMLGDRQDCIGDRDRGNQERQSEAVNQACDRGPDRDSLDKIISRPHCMRQMRDPAKKGNDILYQNCFDGVQPVGC